MNLSLLDICGSALVISKFTLGANCRKGRRPYFEFAAKPDVAENLYNYFVERISQIEKINIVTGDFGAHMDIIAENNGPVTIILDTQELCK